MNKGISLDDALKETWLWGIGEIREIQLITESVTNTSYFLKTILDSYVLRINNPNAVTLGISRPAEINTLYKIQGMDFAPELVYHCPSFKYIVTRYIEGSTFEEQTPTPKEQAALLDIIRQYQGITLNMNNIQYAKLIRNFYDTALRINAIDLKLEQQWQDFQEELQKIETLQWQPVLCHHHLTPSNIIRSRLGLKIIDWECTRNGHPLYDAVFTDIPMIDEDKNTIYLLQQIKQWISQLWALIINAQQYTNLARHVEL